MEWISVKDRLPEEGGWLDHNIICYDGTYVHQTCTYKDGSFTDFYDFLGAPVENVTHWMIIEEPKMEEVGNYFSINK